MLNKGYVRPTRLHTNWHTEPDSDDWVYVLVLSSECVCVCVYYEKVEQLRESGAASHYPILGSFDPVMKVDLICWTSRKKRVICSPPDKQTDGELVFTRRRNISTESARSIIGEGALIYNRVI